ncbi:MAG: DUF5916 domain-containing protein [Candidatus Zixiibacteriota bacterium]
MDHGRTISGGRILAATAVGVCAVGLSVPVGRAQDPTPHKSLTAVRINGHAPDVDGRLDEASWQQAIMVADFLQKEPDEGAVPRERTEVGFLYDDEALYVGARMYSDDPVGLRLHCNRRDQPGGSEQMIVSLDTYRDRRTCYDFGVSVAGVRTDRYHSVDEENDRDPSFNPVWSARTAVEPWGWSAEMRIPFSQLRFNKGDEQVWGVNLNRWIPARNEDDFWIYVPRNCTGWSSRFGELIGIRGIKPSSRLELLPYTAGDGLFTGNRDAGDPLHDGSDFDGRLGGDLKMGLGPNLTLEATVNPDFGQVEADPAVINLTAFETIFTERRPFFVEGNPLFETEGPTYFYSRRIGATPHGEADGDFVDQPTATTILGAGKITGRLASGLSLGVLSALTGREYARVYRDGVKSRLRVEPLTGYSVARLQQEFGEDKSTVGLILTGVGRDLPADDPLASSLRRDAVTGGTDWNLRFQGGAYQLSGYAGFSRVGGSRDAILGTQTASTHYFQRPDAGHVDVDSTRTALWGYTGLMKFEKEAGRHWLWGVGSFVESPGFELNDAGVLRSADNIWSGAEVVYRETTPGRLWRSYRFVFSPSTEWNFDGIRKASDFSLEASATWKNYLSTYLIGGVTTHGLSDDATRGGPLMATPLNSYLALEAHSNYAATTQYGGGVSLGRSETNGWECVPWAQWSTRVGDRLSLSLTPSFMRGESSRQYVGTFDGGPAATYGQRYVFARIEQSELSASMRVNYYFTPDLSLEVYARPFAASGRYHGFGELAAARSYELRLYGEHGTTITETGDGVYQVVDGADTLQIEQPDYGERSFSSNVVLRWEFRPGSTLYLVWQQNRDGEERLGRAVGPRSLWRTFRPAGDNFFAIKISYWIPVS